MNNIYVFWTGDNEITPNRQYCLENLKITSECNIILVTNDNLYEYILNEHPLHEAYQYLSATHKADYLRTYFMNFHGGGYSDIKCTKGSWIESFKELENSDKWMIGYKEFEGCVAYIPVAEYWAEIIGNCSYISKKNTPMTNEWYTEMLSLLDKKLDMLKLHPATYPQACAADNNGYPIGWNEMLGQIFHKLCYKYKDKLITTLPEPICSNYR